MHLKVDQFPADACKSWKVPTTYWAQSGIQMAADGMDLIYADTKTGCHQKTFTTNPDEVDPGDSIISQITVDDSTDLWKIYGYNISNGNFWVHLETISGSTDFKVDRALTSVFFENPNDASENWDPSYSADPKIDRALAREVSNGQWHYWGSQVDYPSGCDPGGYFWAHYASGSLSGSGVTYDVSDIQQHCGVQ